jgi:hypothetical protein
MTSLRWFDPLSDQPAKALPPCTLCGHHGVTVDVMEGILCLQCATGKAELLVMQYALSAETEVDREAN